MFTNCCVLESFYVALPGHRYDRVQEEVIVELSVAYTAHDFQVGKALPVIVTSIGENRDIFISLTLHDGEFHLEPLSCIRVSLNDSKYSQWWCSRRSIK